MKENKLTIFINKPVEKVFEYSLESNNVPKWITSIKEEIPEERPVKLGTKLRNVGVNSTEWNKYEMIEFEYFEWAEKGDLDGLMEISALEILKELIEKEVW